MSGVQSVVENAGRMFDVRSFVFSLRVLLMEEEMYGPLMKVD